MVTTLRILDLHRCHLLLVPILVDLNPDRSIVLLQLPSLFRAMLDTTVATGLSVLAVDLALSVVGLVEEKVAVERKDLQLRLVARTELDLTLLLALRMRLWF